MARTGQGREREEVLSLDNLSKRFCRDLKRSLWYGIQDICREITATRHDSSDLRKQEFWALKDVSLQVRRGECLGLVGANGAGKTTLLRIVSGLMKPDAGKVVVRGKTAPLLALGAGFNPILTGRENIFVNMAILGATKEQIRRAYDSVVSFAEIADAIDAPVLSYSSGMTARLGFACAIHVQPEILIVDEVLSVGDMRFRAKCYRKLAELREAGTSILLVSHNSNDLLSICDRIAFLKQGRIRKIGVAPDALRAYENDLFDTQEVQGAGASAQSGEPAIERVYLTGPAGIPVASLQTASTGAIKLDLTCNQPHADVNLLLIIRSLTGETQAVLNVSSDRDGCLFSLPAGPSTLALEMPVVCLRPGPYTAKLVLYQSKLSILNAIESFRFNVESELNFVSNMYYQPRHWKLREGNSNAAELASRVQTRFE